MFAIIYYFASICTMNELQVTDRAKLATKAIFLVCGFAVSSIAITVISTMGYAGQLAGPAMLGFIAFHYSLAAALTLVALLLYSRTRLFI